jgi:hypothetical protein
LLYQGGSDASLGPAEVLIFFQSVQRDFVVDSTFSDVRTFVHPEGALSLVVV